MKRQFKTVCAVSAVFFFFAILMPATPSVQAAKVPKDAYQEQEKIESMKVAPQPEVERIAPRQELHFDKRTGGIIREPAYVDLIVSKVKITRGEFAGAQKIQIIPYIKNLGLARTSTRIKIWLPYIAAEWIEGGIGSNEEKHGGALYIMDPDGSCSLNFDVVVDNNNTIPESNESNNRCENVSFSPSDTLKIHRCR